MQTDRHITWFDIRFIFTLDSIFVFFALNIPTCLFIDNDFEMAVIETFS